MTVHRLFKGEQALMVEHVWTLAAALEVSPAELLPLDLPSDPRWSSLTTAIVEHDQAAVIDALEQLGVDLRPTAPTTVRATERLMAAADAVSHAGEVLRAAAAAMSPEPEPEVPASATELWLQVMKQRPASEWTGEDLEMLRRAAQDEMRPRATLVLAGRLEDDDERPTYLNPSRLGPDGEVEELTD